MSINNNGMDRERNMNLSRTWESEMHLIGIYYYSYMWTGTILDSKLSGI